MNIVSQYDIPLMTGFSLKSVIAFVYLLYNQVWGCEKYTAACVAFSWYAIMYVLAVSLKSI